MKTQAALADQLQRWRADRMAFRREAIVLEDGRPFGEVMEPWQYQDFEALDSGRFLHAFFERPRGHSKTGDIGTEAVAELMLGRPGSQLFCAAADEDQARLLFDDVTAKFARNPVLAGSVKVTGRDIVVRATGSRLRVLASDAPSAYGLRPDWIAVDELAEWRKRELWDSLWSATGKRPRCRMLVISTAGWDSTSIGFEVRSMAERESDWYFSSRGQCASWISPAWLDQQRRTLPAHVFARLHESRWVEGAGAYLTLAEVDAIFADDLPPVGEPMAIGLDLGIRRDRSVISVVGRLPDGSVAVESLETFRPSGGQAVDLRDVEASVAATAERYGGPVVTDPWQAVLLAQRLRARGLYVIEYAFGPDSRRKLFATLLDLVRTGRLRAKPHEELRRELLGLEVQESAAGWRVDHRPGKHDDHVMATALAATQIAGAEELHVWGGAGAIADLGAPSSWKPGDPPPPWAWGPHHG